MLQIFRKMTTGTASAADIRGALDALDIEGATKSIQRAEGDRRDAILRGDESAVSRAESGLQAARLKYERMVIARADLTSRLAEAEKAEAAARLDAIQRDAERQRDAVRVRITKDLAPALRLACEVLAEIVAADEGISAANAKLMEAGRPMLEPTERGVTPLPPLEYEELHFLRNVVRVPAIPAWSVTGWPPRAADVWASVFAAGRQTG